ncbi:MAG: ATP-binding protein [Pseudomonadota bacterium]
MKLSPPSIRLLLWGLMLLVAIQAFLAWGFYRSANADGDDGFRFPLPSRIAAMVETFEAADPEVRDALLTALSSEDITVVQIPAGDLDASDEIRAQLPQVERIIDEYVHALGQRNVRAWLAPREGESLNAPRLERLRLWSPHPMRLAVSLDTGGWLMIESRGDHARAIFGTPPGFWSGILGLLVASLSLLTLWRGLSPLEKLANSVDSFAAKPVPNLTHPSGPRETRRVIEAVNQMQNNISEDISDRQIMFGALSHDLRTYLTRLKLRIQKIPDAKASERANGDVNAMGAIIEDALLLARLDSEASESIEIFTLGELLDDLSRFNNLDPAKTNIGTGLREVELKANPVSVSRALQNLIDNAEKYGGGVELNAIADGPHLVIDVLDRGPGINPSEVLRLLRPFERGDDARSLETPGSGLGLAITSRVVEQAGGQLELHNRDGGGLVVRITLPTTSA